MTIRLLMLQLAGLTLLAAPNALAIDATEDAGPAIEELNPFDPNVEEKLEEFDKIYEQETGLSPWLADTITPFAAKSGCYRESCSVFLYVDKSNQRANLYLDGRYADSFAVSTGISGFDTPDFDKHPSGRVYDRYTSTKYPEGDYQGLGNMPYAVFISGGFAVHGTPEGNWSRLGRRASHGCVRMHPSNAYQFNRLVRQYGARNSWITVD